MVGRVVLLISVVALLAPVVLSASDETGDQNSDTKRSISVLIRHCTS
jgi:hypothetical protein